MPQQPAYDEYFLFRRIALGDQDALMLLMDKYFPELYKRVNWIVINEELTREIINDVFQRLWDKRKEVATMEHPGGWLIAIARYSSFNALKRENRRASMEPGKLLPDTSNLLDEIKHKELERQIEQAVERLSPQRKIVYKLNHEDGLTRKEIAERLGIAESTVKNLMTQAYKHLRELMKDLKSFFLI